MDHIFFLCILYLCVILFTIFISKKLNFFDVTNFRKLHKEKILNTGGIALYFFYLIILIIYEFSYEIEFVIAIGSIIVLVGFLDDRNNLTPSIKLFFIFGPTLYLILNGFQLYSLGAYEFIGIIKLNKFGLIFTVLACGVLINSINYSDGIDGLATILVLTALLYFNFLLSDKKIELLLYIISIPLLINLIFNFLPNNNPYKLFLGNAGSLFLGFLISFLLIFLFKYKNIHPAFLIWSCWLSIYDFLYVTLYRIKNNKKFFNPDQNHFHHKILIITNKSHLKSCLLITIINLIILIFGYLITMYVGKIFSLLSFILLFFIYTLIRTKLNRWIKQSCSLLGS